MLASVPSATLLGVSGQPVSVEVHLANGLPGFTVVGLPDASCREARDRVRAAITSSAIAFPQRRLTVNLAPSGVRKFGAGFDLAIAVGILVAAGELPADSIQGCSFLAELGLDGSLRRVPGLVPLVAAVTTPAVVVPRSCASEAELPGRHQVRGANTLAEVVAALRGDAPWPDPLPTHPVTVPAGPELADVRGQPLARLALETSAAGRHHLLMVGPPGSGKTMLAHRLAGLLPDLELEEALEATSAHSAAGFALPQGGMFRRPPVRSPHHGASSVALIGGGSAWMKPGEVSLATGGVLFLASWGSSGPTCSMPSVSLSKREWCV